ncbi:MAG: hypothetical protein HY904_05115 [Deltaproteobacteria bacterium]|nr:hypothetical protein [Deltaproteobacteria bacterium]
MRANWGLWAVAGTIGCAAPWDQAVSPAVAVESAFLRGQVGYVDQIDQVADDAFLSDDGAWTTLQVMVDRQGEAAMALVDIQGGLGLLIQGEVPEWTEGRSLPQPLVVTGCSGLARGMWDYDAEADLTDVRIVDSPAPGLRRVEFVSHWAGDHQGLPPHSVQGHLDVRALDEDRSPPEGAAAEPSGLPVVAGNGVGTLHGARVLGRPAQAAASSYDGGRAVVLTWTVDRRDVVVAVDVRADRVDGPVRDGAMDVSAAMPGWGSPALSELNAQTTDDGAQRWYAFTARWVDGSELSASFALPR